jgi:hypothetical protein
MEDDLVARMLRQAARSWADDDDPREAAAAAAAAPDTTD